MDRGMDRIWQDFKYSFRSLRRGGLLIVIAIKESLKALLLASTLFSGFWRPPGRFK